MRADVPERSPAYPVTYGETEVVSVYVEPPLSEPQPIAVPWAPPPMLAEWVPPRPYPGAVWVGGYWVWQGNWVWATGRWAPPPRSDYAWVQPYYEHRDGVVIFITGHWCPPGVGFVPPPRGMRFNVMAATNGARRGYAPIGPPGVFLPPPPGSRPGLIVPVPLGTPPAVMRGAPPVPIMLLPRQRPEPAVQGSVPAPVTSWRAVPGRPMPAVPAPLPVQDRERDRGAHREDGARAAWMRDHAFERPQDRMPIEPPRRQMQAAPLQTAPAPEPAVQPAMRNAPPRGEAGLRMEAPIPRPPVGAAAPQPRHEENARHQRPGEERGDKDKKDPKGP